MSTQAQIGTFDLNEINLLELKSSIDKSYKSSMSKELEFQRNCDSCSFYIENLSQYIENIDSLNDGKNIIEILKKFKKAQINNEELDTFYLIEFWHDKNESFPFYDLFIIYQANLKWDVFNLNNKTRKNFLKRNKTNEFSLNFQFIFNKLNNSFEFNNEYNYTCFTGQHTIFITKVFKKNETDLNLSYETRFNLNNDCFEENLFEYMFGFKTNLNPESH